MEILTKYPNKVYTEPLSEMYSRKINFNAIHFVKSNNNKNFIKTHECWVLCVFICSLQRFKNWITNRSLSTKPFSSIDAVFCCCNVFSFPFLFFLSMGFLWKHLDAFGYLHAVPWISLEWNHLKCKEIVKESFQTSSDTRTSIALCSNKHGKKWFILKILMDFCLLSLAHSHPIYSHHIH